MANRRFEQFKYSLIKKQTEIEGVIALAADASVSSTNIPGASAAKTDTGEYTITLQDKYPACMGIYCSIGENDEAIWAKPGAADVSSAKTVVIKTKDETGADADVSATAKLYVKIVLRNSSVS
jgi:hypothetical protein